MTTTLPIPSISVEALFAARDATIDALRKSRADAETIYAIENDPAAVQLLDLLRGRVEKRVEMTVHGAASCRLVPPRAASCRVRCCDHESAFRAGAGG